MADIEDKEAVITIKVILESDIEGELAQQEGGATDRPDFFGEAAQQKIQEIEDKVKEIEETFGGLDINAENLTDFINKLDKQGLNELTQFAKNPQGFLEHGLIRLIGKAGPYGALVLAIITAILAGPQLYKAMVETLAVKGGPLNQDFRYSLDEQENQQFDRMTQYSRLVGDDPVIRVSTKGYIVGDADFVGNSLIDAPLARTARIGLRESSLGVIDGI